MFNPIGMMIFIRLVLRVECGAPMKFQGFNFSRLRPILLSISSILASYRTYAAVSNELNSMHHPRWQNIRCGYPELCFSSYSTLRSVSPSSFNPTATEREHSSTSNKQRIARIISNRGGGSRKEVNKLLQQRRVTVDGRIVISGAAKYPGDSKIEVDGQALQAVPILAAFHKPHGMLSTVGDPWGRRNLEELLTPLQSHTEGADGKMHAWDSRYPRFLRSMHPVGRLDADTTGLLLFSSCGKLTQYLLSPACGVEREYEALVQGAVNAQEGSHGQAPREEIKSKAREATVVSAVVQAAAAHRRDLGSVLRAGVKTTDGVFSAHLLESRVLTTSEAVGLLSLPAGKRLILPLLNRSNTTDSSIKRADSFKYEVASSRGSHLENSSIDSRLTVDRDLPPFGADSDFDADAMTQRRLFAMASVLEPESKPESVPTLSLVRLKVAEGKYRMVRRMLHNAGHSVLALHRTRYGSVQLLRQEKKIGGGEDEQEKKIGGGEDEQEKKISGGEDEQEKKIGGWEDEQEEGGKNSKEEHQRKSLCRWQVLHTLGYQPDGGADMGHVLPAESVRRCFHSEEVWAQKLLHIHTN